MWGWGWGRCCKPPGLCKRKSRLHSTHSTGERALYVLLCVWAVQAGKPTVHTVNFEVFRLLSKYEFATFYFDEKKITVGWLLSFNNFFSLDFIKGQLISKKIVKPRILPKNEQMNSFLLVCDMFLFVFWENPWLDWFAFEINWPLHTSRFAFKNCKIEYWGRWK